MTLAAGARPGVSVIIPTHNRREMLEDLLRSLRSQTYPVTNLEIVICADDCRDGTASMLKEEDPLLVTVLELPGVGPAEARNAGARMARAPLLVFLDDDVLPTPGLIEAHVRAQEDNPGSVVLGPYPPVPWASQSLSRLAVRRWWTEHFATMAEPGHRIWFSDVLTGNLSVPAEIWQDVGGLNARLRAREDYELGIRLMRAGIPIVLAPGALGHHRVHESTGLAGTLRRARDEGRADALIARKHPQARDELRLIGWRRSASWRTDALHRTVLRGSARMDRGAEAMERLVTFLDHRGLRRLHTRLFHRLNGYWYIRGVGESLGSFAAWQDLAAAPAQILEPPALVLDLRQGLAAAEAVLDAERPQRVALRYGERTLGHLHHSAVAERWRGRHLRPHLYAQVGAAYLHCLAEDGAFSDGDPRRTEHLVAAIDRMGRFFGRGGPPYTFWEQHEQWRRFPSLDT
jgi:GT2 family glycosyltransferase